MVLLFTFAQTKVTILFSRATLSPIYEEYYEYTYKTVTISPPAQKTLAGPWCLVLLRASLLGLVNNRLHCISARVLVLAVVWASRWVPTPGAKRRRTP